MPHYKNGQEVKQGDRVAIFGTVKDVYSSEELCNVTFESVEPFNAEGTKSQFSLNTKQLEYIGEGAPTPKPVTQAEQPTTEAAEESVVAETAEAPTADEGAPPPPTGKP
jgi:hypothetical protein